VDNHLLNLESWLDNECDDTQQPRSTRIGSSPIVVDGSDLQSQTSDARINKGYDDSLLVNMNSNSNDKMKNDNEQEAIVEETKEDSGDDDELDDWLDSVIE